MTDRINAILSAYKDERLHEINVGAAIMDELFLSCPVDFLDCWIWMRPEKIFAIMREGAD